MTTDFAVKAKIELVNLSMNNSNTLLNESDLNCGEIPELFRVLVRIKKGVTLIILFMFRNINRILLDLHVFE